MHMYVTREYMYMHDQCYMYWCIMSQYHAGMTKQLLGSIHACTLCIIVYLGLATNIGRPSHSFMSVLISAKLYNI